MKLKVLKSWLDPDYTLIFQVQIIAEKGLFPKKTHLLLDLRQQSFGVKLSAQKPAQATSNAAFVQILRKHLPNITIKDLLLDEKAGDITIPLLGGTGGDRPWSLRLMRSRPPLASLLDPAGLIHVSYGQKGTFTKKHQAESLPEFSGKNLLPDLLQALKNEADAEPEAAREENEEKSVDASENPLTEAQKDLISRLKRKLKTTRKNAEKLRGEIPEAEEVQRLEQHAYLLQSYAYLIKQDSIELILDSALTGQEGNLAIPLDPDLSKGRNIEVAFERYRRARKKREMTLEQLEQNAELVTALESDIEFLRANVRFDSDLSRLIQKYRLPTLASVTTRSSESSAKAWKTYVSSSGHLIFVGKGASENDELTKAARSNDYWLHAVGVTGSHVIIPITNDLRQAMPQALLHEASVLALHFSRLKEDRGGECYVTRKGFLKKQKGMPAGLWRIDQSETIFVRYNDIELQKVLQTLRQ